MSWTPNRRARTEPVGLIVLHSTGGSFASAVSWLMSKLSRVSAHYVVSRTGEVRKLAPVAEVTWHAGRSEWAGRSNVNAFSVGIEMEHVDRKQDWPTIQVQAVIELIDAIRIQVGKATVTSHRHIARPAGRKPDPVGFPWERIPGPKVW